MGVNYPFTPPHLQSLPYCNTIARPFRNIRPLTDPPCVWHKPYIIGDGNIVLRPTHRTPPVFCQVLIADLGELTWRLYHGFTLRYSAISRVHPPIFCYITGSPSPAISRANPNPRYKLFRRSLFIDAAVWVWNVLSECCQCWKLVWRWREERFGRASMFDLAV